MALEKNTGNRKCVKVNGIEAIVSVANFKKYCKEGTCFCCDLEEVFNVYM